MSTSAIIMMVVGLGTVWGGVIVTVMIALGVEKKNKLKASKQFNKQQGKGYFSEYTLMIPFSFYVKFSTHND